MTESKARAGSALPAAQSSAVEAKTAVADFLNAFRSFQGEVSKSLQQQEERPTMLDRKTMTE